MSSSSRAWEFGVGAIQPSWFGKGHIPPGWSVERHTVHMKIFIVLPAPLASVAKTTFLRKFLHSRRAVWLVVGGIMYRFQAGCPFPSPVPMSSFLTRSMRVIRMDLRRYRSASSMLLTIFGMLSLWFATNLRTPFAASEPSFPVNSVLATISSTSSAVLALGSSRNMNPLRVVMNV